MLVLIKGLGVGGAEKLLSEGARFWDRDRFHYEIAYALPWKDQLVGELEALGMDVHLIGDDRGLSIGVVRRLRKLMANHGFDLVHAHSPTLGVIARLVSRVPVVYTEHNMSESYRTLTRVANRSTYRRNAAVIAVSGAVAGSVGGWPGPAPRVITNGVSCSVDAAGAAAARDELGLAEGASLVVHVGNIRPGKGHDMLIDAVAAHRSFGREVTWVSIGGEKYPGDLKRVRTRAETEGLGASMRFLGRRSDALAFVAAADLFVNPSEVEGLPVAVLEAMALERPVVATAVGGVPGIVKDGETGLLVEPGDSKGLAHGVERVLAEPALARRLAHEGRALVEREYGLEAMVRNVEAVYEDVLA